MTDSWPSFLAASISSWLVPPAPAAADAPLDGAALDPLDEQAAKARDATASRPATRVRERCVDKVSPPIERASTAMPGCVSCRHSRPTARALLDPDRPSYATASCGPTWGRRDRSPCSHWTARTGGRQEIVRGLLTRRERCAYVRSILLRNRRDLSCA